MCRLKQMIFALLIVQGLCFVEGLKSSHFDNLIAPEIKNDAFYHAIQRISSTERLSNILEIGSACGTGSTEAFVLGIGRNRYVPKLFCMEVSKARCEALRNLYMDHPQVRCYNVSSVPLQTFPTDEEVIAFYQTKNTNLNHYPLEEVLGWLHGDKDYIESEGVPQNGIELIKRENGIDQFDMVLIDGSEFTGMAEMELIYGARFILLDDIQAFKNYANHRRLMADPNYELVEENCTLRNGYSIFKRR